VTIRRLNAALSHRPPNFPPTVHALVLTFVVDLLQ